MKYFHQKAYEGVLEGVDVHRYSARVQCRMFQYQGVY